MTTPRLLGVLVGVGLLAGGCGNTPADLEACARAAWSGLRPVAEERDRRFLGKVGEDRARCRGGTRAAGLVRAPFVDWPHYWAAGDGGSRLSASDGVIRFLRPDRRGIGGALIDLEYQRIELLRFNLFDNTGTYREYVLGRGGVAGPLLRVWTEMRLPPSHPSYAAVGGPGEQLCAGELVRHRTLTGICNDLRNPLMGSAGMPFARNVEFEDTFPDLGRAELARNRHGARLALLRPDPQVISRRLLSRPSSSPDTCHGGRGLPGYSPAARCDYKAAPSLNVLAAFWIQFMTHDWFSHLTEGRNSSETIAMGCRTARVDDVEQPLTREAAARLGCRPADRVAAASWVRTADPSTFDDGGRVRLARAYRMTLNTVTAWWDASQLYGHDEASRRRVKRDPADPAKLRLLVLDARPTAGDRLGYLPAFEAGDPINPVWAGQEATAFPDNWSVGLSFLHNVFAREHNLFVDAFRRHAAATPDADSGLRRPGNPDRIVRYRDVGDDELFEVARLVIAAEIAKIHTIEWTPQILYDEPMRLALEANWSGLLADDGPARTALAEVVRSLGRSPDAAKASAWYSVFASGPGIFGLGNRVSADGRAGAADVWSLANPDHVNGGTNHFGSPFNFPEEFVTAYRLHPMVPDLLEYRTWADHPDVIRLRIPVVDTFRGRATAAMRERGIASWALSLGRQRLGRLTLQNHPRFLQDLPLPHPGSPAGRIDVATLDIIRDRERGVPRFNEFRRQYGLRQLTSFDDFIDRRLPAGGAERAEQERLVGILREVYGQHACDASKLITDAQLNDDGSRINDCLGHPDGSRVDNVEDVDTVVGWLAEFPRPHGFAISETQLQVFVLNASRRLFSDRFFTSSFRPEFYGHLGIRWVNENGPDGKVLERAGPGGRAAEVSPMKRVLLRTIPELGPELAHVVNAFDPWARDRGDYYALDWKPRPGAEADEAFR
ncbi:MAG TPA: peroxidase family protein [Methylomirabilota bacterium]